MDDCVIDFSQFNDTEQALRAWLEPSLSLRVAINLPPNTQEDKEVHNNNNNNDNTNTIAPPFPWATNEYTKVHSLDYLLSNGITTIKGQLQCRRCDNLHIESYDLLSKFREVEHFAHQHIHVMHQRAPKEWMLPMKKFADCSQCGQVNSMKPVVAEERENINWMFLFLGQSLGVCTIGQLKWFCEKSKKHRTGAKDRVLYLTYVGIGTQLDPEGVFKGWSDVR